MTRTIRKLARSEDELHEAASRKTGFDNFGDPVYRQGLRVLLDAFDSDLQLTEAGWQVAYGRMLRILTARLYAQKGWAERPDVLAIPIRRPLVIIGLPRTGTTALQRLLALDSQLQGPELWLVETPMIRPPHEIWDTQPTYRACVANLEEIYTRVPQLRAASNTTAGELAECGGVLMQSFVSEHWSAYGLPTYTCWLLSQSARDSYRRYVDVLRLIGAGEQRKPWLLKCPYHMAEIDTLLEAFPDACIIQTHRDPLEAIPSFCSLRHMVARNLEGDAAQPDVIGPLQCGYWRKALDRTQAARQRSSMQFFDVDHRRFLRDPLGIVRSIYENFGLTLAPNTQQQMRAWIAAAPMSRHGKHQYTVDSWGVTHTQICDTFADYRAQYQFN